MNWVGTRIFLVPIYWLVFAIGHLLLRIRGKDPMQRRLDPDVASYWEDRPPVTDMETYRKQF